MKRAIFFGLALFAITSGGYGQLTLDAGESYYSEVLFTGPGSASGTHMPGLVCVSFDPATVQPGDAVLLEAFEHAGDGLFSSQAFTNAVDICSRGAPFAWWDR